MLPDTEALRPGYAATVAWLREGIRFYKACTGEAPERIVLNRWVLSDINEELGTLPGVSLEDVIVAFDGIPVQVDNERCKPNICDDAITYLEGPKGVYWLICDATPRVGEV